MCTVAQASSASKIVLITGTSSGIGREAALYFANRGWNVAATMRSPEKSDLAAKSDRIRLFKLDVTDEASIAACVVEVIAAFGAIDVLVNNAGYGLVGPFEAQTDAQIRRQFETNVFGLMNMCRAVLPHMRERRQGRIVNVASVAGRITIPLFSSYCATKWAVEGFSEALWLETRHHNIKVKVIEPGMIKTDFFERSMELARKPGLTAYDDFIATVQPNIEAWEQAAPGPEIVARDIWRAATSWWPTLRYQPNGKFAVFGRYLAPTWLYVRVVRRMFNAW